MSIDTTQANDTATVAVPALVEGPAVVLVDPRALTLEVNVRAEAALDKEFVASIAQHGVLTPVLVVREADGTLRVRAGQRRTLAAVEAGRESIPAYVVDGDGDEARRIIEQVVENDHRRALGEPDRLAAFQQLSLLGVSAAQIAKRTGTRRERVNDALTVAASPIASAVVAKYDLTLDQAAVIADFDGDDEAVKALTTTAVQEPGKFEHLAQRLRDQRAEAQAVAALAATWAENGYAVIDQPEYGSTSPVRRLDRIATLVEDERQVLTPQTHATCPGRAVYILGTAWNREEPEAVEVCTDPAAHGHVSRYPEPVSAPAKASGPMSEAQKAERRTLIANNKDWRSAETVRRAWLATFAARKSAPKDAPAFLAARLLDVTTHLDRARNGGNDLARTLLGLPARAYGQADPIAAAITAATPARATHLALVLVLAAIETDTSTNTWRNPSGRPSRDASTPRASRERRAPPTVHLTLPFYAAPGTDQHLVEIP